MCFLAKRAQDGSSLLVLAYAARVKPRRASHARLYRFQSPPEAAAPALPLACFLAGETREMESSRNDRGRHCVVQAKPSGRDRFGLGVAVHVQFSSRMRMTRSASLSRRQYSCSMWQGRAPLREQGRHGSSFSTTLLRGSRGKYPNSRLVGPNTAKTGIPAASLRCISPLPLHSRTRQRDRRAASARRSSSPR